MNIWIHMSLVEDNEVDWFSWHWLAWEDLSALDECLSAEDAYLYIEEIDFIR